MRTGFASVRRQRNQKEHRLSYFAFAPRLIHSACPTAHLRSGLPPRIGEFCTQTIENDILGPLLVQYGPSNGWWPFATGRMVLGNARVYSLVDSRNHIDECSRPVSYGYSFPTFLQFPCRVCQITGMFLPVSHNIASFGMVCTCLPCMRLAVAERMTSLASRSGSLFLDLSISSPFD